MIDFDSLQDDSATKASAAEQGQPASVPFDQLQDDSEKYGSVGQQALAGVEGAAKGFLGPIATGAERLLSESGVPGLAPEDQSGRESANPVTHGLAEAAGFGAGALTGTGEAALLEGAGKLLAPTAQSIVKIGSLAAKGAIEMGMLQGGDEISRRINEDPEQTAGSVIAHIGLSSLLGAGGSAALGTIFPKWAVEHEEPVEQGLQSLKNSADGTVVDQTTHAPLETLEQESPTATELKTNAVAKIADKNDWPILEGMVSDKKEIKMAEDALLNGPPTMASIGRRKLYMDALGKVTNDVDKAAASSSQMSETQVGQNLKDSLLQKLGQTYEPIKQMYAAIEPYRQAISLSDASTGSLSRNIMKIAEEQGVVPGSERYNFLKTFSDGLDNVDNLQKLANFRTEVNRSSGPLTKDLAQAINEKLNGVEERAIKRFADTMRTQNASDKILDVIEQANQAKKGYAAFREQLQELGNNIGKKKIYGPQNFMDFVEDMNPQTLTRRLFNENNTEFAQYFAKNFPEEMQTMRQYQRGLIRQGAMKDGVFNAGKAVKSILDMEPETQKLLFTPEEIAKVKDAQKYLASFPKSFNPSGTAHESAFRAFFESPTGAAVANIRDFGIQAFIKAFGRAAPGAENEAERLIPLLGKQALSQDPNAPAFKNSVDYLMSAIRGEQLITRSARALFAGTLPDALSSVDSHRVEVLDKRLKDYAENPDLHANVGGQMGYYLGNHDIALKGAAANAVNYLNSLRPVPVKGAPLDKTVEPSGIDKSQYKRALTIAEKPLSVLALLKQGRLTDQDLTHLNNLYPGLSNRIRQDISEHMIGHVAKGKTIPYQMRVGLSALMAQPLDSSISPQSIHLNQAALAGSAQQNAQKSSPKVSKPGLRDMTFASRTGLHSQDSSD